MNIVLPEKSHLSKDSFFTFSRACYDLAKENGWHETRRPADVLFLLIASEIMEAFEAYRKNEKPFDVIEGKPEGEAVEIVDAMIRIGDFAGLIGDKLTQSGAVFSTFNFESSTAECGRGMNRPAFYKDVMRAILSAKHLNDTSTLSFLYGSYTTLYSFVLEEFGLDPMFVARQKLAYNMSRGHRHGGKVV